MYPAIKETSYIHAYKGADIPYTVWSSGDGTGPVEIIIFLGTVQIESLARWVAEGCPPNAIVVQGALHWFAKSDGSDIPEYMFDFTKCVFDTLLKDFLITKSHIIAESQAVPGVLGLFRQKKYLPYIKKLTLLQPLGLNVDVYKGTDKQRIKVFRRRIAANFLYQLPTLLSDKRLRYNHRFANKIVGVSLRDPKARAQYGSGLMHDAVSNLKYLYAHHRDIAIICGAKDKIFPPAEIMATLVKSEINIPIEIIKGVPHSPLATRYGQKLLSAALNR